MKITQEYLEHYWTTIGFDAVVEVYNNFKNDVDKCEKNKVWDEFGPAPTMKDLDPIGCIPKFLEMYGAEIAANVSEKFIHMLMDNDALNPNTKEENNNVKL